MIQGYQYDPQMSLPQTLSSFLYGQSRQIEQACMVNIFFCGEGLDPLSVRMEEDLTQRFHTPLEEMRRFSVEFPDGYIYRGYLAHLEGGGWYIPIVEMFYRLM
jgi:hypothetical protein